MATTFKIPDHFYRAYTSNVEMLLYQKGGKLTPYVGMESFSGEAAQYIKQFGEVSMQEITTRYQATEWTELEHRQRWVFPKDYYLAIPVYKQDELRMLDSPMSPYVAAGRDAVAKKMDTLISEAFFASARTGVNGADTTAYDTNNDIAVNVQDGAGSGDVGLNVAKLRAARRALKEAFVDIDAETPLIAVTAQQMDDLLKETSIISADYNTVRALVAGEVDTFMGFRFIQGWEGLPTNAAGTQRYLPVWVPSGMKFCQWEGLRTKIDELPTKTHTTQIAMYMTASVTRTLEAKVHRILCAI